MQLGLFALVIIAFVLVVVFWYFTRDYRSIPDDRVIDLATNENRLLDAWYAHHLQPSLALDLNDQEIAARCLDRMYHIQVDPQLLVIGEELTQTYFRLTGISLPISDQLEPGVDQIFDLRKIIGRPGQIAIIHSQRYRDRLGRSTNYDTGQLQSIMDLQLDSRTQTYLNEILKYRWGKISELNDPHLISGSDATYIYLRECRIPNVTTTELQGMHKLNLLCTDLEFATLIQRWQKSISTPEILSPEIISLA